MPRVKVQPVVMTGRRAVGRSVRGGLGRGLAVAFTIVELLVVIVVILIVLSIATPAFRALVYSSERSLAFNSVEAGVASARDLALRAGGGGDGAVVFLFDPGGPVRIIPAVKVGTVTEPAESGRLDAVGSITMDVFAPVPEVAAVEMPPNWHVRGYAAPGSMVDLLANGEPFARWYNSPTTGNNNPGSPVKEERNWVFPESGFYATDFQVPPAQGGGGGVQVQRNTPTGRQSFMIRFDGRTGAMSSDRGLALFIDPRPSTADRPGGDRPRARQLWLRADRAENLGDWAQGVLNAPPFDGQGNPIQPPYRPVHEERGRLSFIGSPSNDTVLVKPVTRLAVYDGRRLAVGVGARGLNEATASLYHPVAPDGRGGYDGPIGFDEALFRDFPGNDALRERINRWIEGDTSGPDGEPDGLIDIEFDDPEARLYLVRPSTGELTEVVR